MSNYPWGGAVNPNPYTGQNDYGHVGVQSLDTTFENSDYVQRPQRDDADREVSTPSGLVQTLSSSDGEVIWVENEIYDMTSQPRRIDIPAGTTLASDGAVIQQLGPKDGIFNVTNDDVRISGIRFEGYEIGYVDSYDATRAMLVRGTIEIDNCEFYGFPTAAIDVEDGGDPHIHHNVIRDNQGSAHGFGVITFAGDPLIEYNFFNGNRHSVSGGGSDESSYRASNNLHGEDGLGYQFEQQADGGGTMDIQNNEFRMVQTDNSNPARAYAQGGTPGDNATIEYNRILNPNEPGSQPDTSSDAAIVQYNHGSSDWVSVEFGNNEYGDDSVDSNVGIQPLSGESEFDGFEGETDSEGMVEAQIPDGNYTVTADHEDYDTTAEGTVTVDGADEEITISFGSEN